MTIEQITAINNSMSVLSDMVNVAGCITSLEDFKQYVNKHTKELKDAGVDNFITEHFGTLMNKWTPIVESSVKLHAEYEKECEEFCYIQQKYETL